MQNNTTDETKSGKVIPMESKSKQNPIQHDYDVLLKSLGYETLIGMITPEEVEDAEILLADYLKNFFSPDRNKKIVFAYLFGVKQGLSDMYGERAGKALADNMINIAKMGMRTGFLQAYMHFTSGKKD